MPSPTMLTGPEQPPSSGRAPEQLVVFLHGYGADGNDLIDLAELLDLPDAQFLSPHAPFAFELAPFGRQWFSLMDRSEQAMCAGVQQAAPLLNAYLDAQLARIGLAPSQLVLVGFSQGTMTALYTALRRPEPIAGIVGFSGALLAADRLATEITARPPVCLIHGQEDAVVPFEAMALAQEGLSRAGVPVEAQARPGLGHGIDEAGLSTARRFLQRVFA